MILRLPHHLSHRLPVFAVQPAVVRHVFTDVSINFRRPGGGGSSPIKRGHCHLIQHLRFRVSRSRRFSAHRAFKLPQNFVCLRARQRARHFPRVVVVKAEIFSVFHYGNVHATGAIAGRSVLLRPQRGGQCFARRILRDRQRFAFRFVVIAVHLRAAVLLVSGDPPGKLRKRQF